MGLTWNPQVVAEAANHGLSSPSDLERTAERIGAPLLVYSTADWTIDQLRTSLQLTQRGLDAALADTARPARLRLEAIEQARAQFDRAKEHLDARLSDPCKAGLWDIEPTATCPICGALPDTDCEAAKLASAAILHGAFA